MNKAFYLLLCLLISSDAFASENNQAELDLEELGEPHGDTPLRDSLPEIFIDNGLPDLRPDGTLGFAQELANSVYDKQCDPNKFCINPFQNHLKKLKKDNPQQYNHITALLLEKKAKRTRAAHQKRGRSLTPTGDIPIELLKVALKALKEEDTLKANAITAHEGTIEEHIGTIQTLKKYGTWKERGLMGSVVLILLQTGGYFLYTYLSSC